MSINKSYVMASAAIMASAIVLPLADVSQVDAASQTITVTARVNFRKGPSMDYSVIKKLYKGYELTYLGQKGNWIKVKYKKQGPSLQTLAMSLLLLILSLTNV